MKNDCFLKKYNRFVEFIYFFFRAFFTMSTLDAFSLVTTIFGMLLAFAFFRLSRFFRLFSSCFQIINFWLHSLSHPRDRHTHRRQCGRERKTVQFIKTNHSSTNRTIKNGKRNKKKVHTRRTGMNEPTIHSTENKCF